MKPIATAFLQAALKSGMITPNKIRKNGEMKKRAGTNKCWPRLHRGRAKFQQRVVE